MDIKNILNTAERRSLQPNADDPDTIPTRHPLPPNSSISNPPTHPPPLPLEPPDRLVHPLPSTSTPHFHPSHSPSSPQPSSQIHPPPPHHHPPPQQIVYTGPVYQLQPPLQLRHIPNPIHYRYTPYSTYDETPHVDYTVYQQYSQRSRLRSHDSCCHRSNSPNPHPYQPSTAPDLSRSRPRSRHQVPQPPLHRHHSPSPRPPPPLPQHYPYQTDSHRLQSRNSRSPTPTPPHPSYHPNYSPTQPPRRPQTTSASYTVIHSMPTDHSLDRFDPQSASHHSSYPNNHPSPLFPRYAGYVSYHGPPHRSMDPYHTHPTPSSNLTACPVHSSPPPPSLRPIRPNSPSTYPTMDHTVHSPTHLHLNHQFSHDHEHPMPPNAPHQKKRERLTPTMHSHRSESPHPASTRPHLDKVVEDESPKHLTPYNPNFLRACSVERDSERNCDPSPPQLSTLRVSKKNRHSRILISSTPKTAVTVHRNTNRTEIWASDPTASRNKNRINEETLAESEPPKTCASVKSEKSVSPVSAQDEASAAEIGTLGNNDMPLAETTPWPQNNVIVIEDDTPTVSDREQVVSSRDNDIAQSLGESEAWSHQADHLSASEEDPEEPYPETSTDFSGIPANAIGDLLQLWEFVSSFCKTLRLSPFKLRHLEQAIAHNDRSSLLDACVTRLVQSILADAGLVDELGVPDSLMKKLAAKGTKNLANAILAALPDILSFESEEVEDHFLDEAVQQIAGSSNKCAFYQVLEPTAKLRVLRELVDYAAMADTLRECVTDSLEHAEEERKKARDQNVANRKKLEMQIREHKLELHEYRVKHKLLEMPTDSDKEKGAQDSKGSTVTGKESNGTLSRKQKLLAAREERKNEEQRRMTERGAEAIIAKIERDKASLKALKNMRIRSRASMSAREGESFDESAAAPSIPFVSLHEDPIRTHPLGTDRYERCYWFFEGSGRLWIEDTNKGEWCTVKDAKNLAALSRWLSPNRREEKQLERNLRSRRDVIVAEMVKEAKEIEMAEAELQEAQDSALEILPRSTRARKRKAESKSKKAKAKKSRRALNFRDYRNLEK